MHQTGVAASTSTELSKRCQRGTHRLVEPAATLERVQPFLRSMGITRVADITHLDRIGIPVVAVHRPNSRSLSVAQGKGIDAIAAQVSGVMESIETYHAEHCELPLLFGSAREMTRRHRVVDVRGLPRLALSTYHDDRPMLWAAGHDLLTGERVLVPYEMVHLDFRIPLPSGSGSFLMSSNGLASGNHLTEAISHAVCELIERDANTLWQLNHQVAKGRTRVDLSTIDDAVCQTLLRQLERVEVDVIVWETTSNVGIAAFLCIISDRQVGAQPVHPVAGSGCHPHRAVALLRALTEAAQGRLTDISGARDDLSGSPRYDPQVARSRCAELQQWLQAPPVRSFQHCPDANHSTLEQDLEWELQCLSAVGLSSVVVVNLTRAEFDIPVVRVIVPYLESMAEVEGYAPGLRAQHSRRGASA